MEVAVCADSASPFEEFETLVWSVWILRCFRHTLRLLLLSRVGPSKLRVKRSDLDALDTS